MAKVAKSASRRFEATDSAKGHTKVNSAIVKEKLSAVKGNTASVPRSRHWSHAVANREIVDLLDERLLMTAAMRRALQLLKSAVRVLSNSSPPKCCFRPR